MNVTTKGKLSFEEILLVIDPHSTITKEMFASWPIEVQEIRSEIINRSMLEPDSVNADLLAACKSVMEFLSNGTPVRPGSLVQAEIFNAIQKAEGK